MSRQGRPVMTEHLPIQRWTKIFTRYPASEVLPNESGEYVTYADHLADLRACEERVARAFHRVRAVDRVEWARFARDQFDKGYAAAISQAVHRIESLPAAAIRGYVGITETQVTAALKELKGDD